MTAKADGVYRTGNLSLATLLVGVRFKYVLKRHERSEGNVRCIWEFEIPDDRIAELRTIVDTYRRKESRVEPASFLSAVANVRREMYTFLRGDTPSANAA